MPFLRRIRPAVEQRAQYSIGDPALAEFLGMSGRTDAGVSVNETSALGLTAVYRSVALIAGSIAQLPLKSYRRVSDNERTRIKSFLDNPGGAYLTPFEFKELVLVHLLLHGNAYLLHVYNGAGAIDSLYPIHPGLVSVKAHAEFGRIYEVTTNDGVRTYTPADLTHVPALSTDGLKGLSPISAARNAIGTGLAGEQAAARMFSSGLLLGGIVSSDETLTQEQAETIKAGLKANLSGSRNAGDIAVVNASLKFSPWSMNAEDAQFIETRVHQVEEVARIFGVPPHLLGQTEKQTSWGAGVSEQNRGLSVFTLSPWTKRIEERLTRLLAPATQYAEFDHAGLLAGTPAQEIPLLISQVQAGLLTLNEARSRMNLAPLPGGDSIAPPKPEPEVRSAAPSQPLYMELRQEPTTINVPTPVVNVTVDPTPVSVAVEAPTVNVKAPTVNVKNEVQVPPPGERSVKFARNQQGLIVGAEISE